MKASTFALALVASYTALALGAPAAERVADVVDAPLEKRANGGLYICNNINFGAPCVHLSNPFGDCVNLDSNFNDQVSSLGPDAGARCTFHVNYGCSGDFLQGITNPGISDLRTVGFNDKISSYYCTT
ncbi:hypothetical protein MMC30_009372 [Trapelia coarctata]|nr:hypothetical protein [Trapelia coarctata]